ncbi:endothelial cell-selective adhesion molecule, partial [Pelodytes ibericus]
LAGLSSALLEVHVQKTTIVAVEGENITLSVSYTSSSVQSPYVTWLFERQNSKEVQILKYLGGTMSSEEPQFKGRLSFVYTMPSKNISIAIHKVQESDSGWYKCYVDVADDVGSKGSNIGQINVTILVVPSVPKCQIHGTPYIGSNTTLSCQSAIGKPSPSYFWTRTSPDTQVFFAPAQDTQKGTLTLRNLTSEMSGMYVCISKNQAGSSNCSIMVQVTSYSRTAMIVGAVIGSIAGFCCLVILMVVLIYFYRRKKKDSQDEMENEIKEDSQAPKPMTWVKSNESDIVFKNGTLSSVNTNRDHKAYNSKSPSDTASVTTTTGSNLGYKPNYPNERVITTPTLSNQSLPSYMAPQNGSYYNNARAHTDNLQKPNGHNQQAPKKQINITSGVTPSNLVRMGAVPVMVPAQSQAGSLV